MASTLPELATVEFTAVADFEEWLATHHTDAPGVWVKLARTGSKSDALTFGQALQVTLCYGWFTGVRRTVDSEHYLQKCTPGELDRRWEWIECDTAEWLIEAGRMQPAGLAYVEAAKASDRWERAYAARGALPIPNLLRARMASFPEAKAFFESLDERDRNAIAFRLQGILDRETYMRRVNEITEMLRKGERPYQS
jgi:uncharacterized protein YdeI (YjbR/CyaY-like superfamily)